MISQLKHKLMLNNCYPNVIWILWLTFQPSALHIIFSIQMHPSLAWVNKYSSKQKIRLSSCCLFINFNMVNKENKHMLSSIQTHAIASDTWVTSSTWDSSKHATCFLFLQSQKSICMKSTNERQHHLLKWILIQVQNTNEWLIVTIRQTSYRKMINCQCN